MIRLSHIIYIIVFKSAHANTESIIGCFPIPSHTEAALLLALLDQLHAGLPHSSSNSLTVKVLPILMNSHSTSDTQQGDT